MVFSEKLPDERTVEEVWSHEQGHYFFEYMPEEERRRYGEKCLSWLEANASDVYNKIKNYYSEEERDTEACAYFISETVKIMVWRSL